MNINKIIYKAIAQGFEGDPSSSNLLHIQDWIIRKYKLIPFVNWDTKNKAWKACVYEYDYDSVDWINRIKNKKNISSKEATQALNKYLQEYCVVKDKNNNDRFYDSELALYSAVEFAMNKGIMQ